MAFLRGHLTTLWPYVRHRVRPFRAPAGEPWSTELEDPDVGTVRLTGELHVPQGARDLFVLLHGLGGSPDSYYIHRCAAAVAEQGGATLGLALRGADRRGDDFYNIALTADLHATLASPALARFERIYLVGYSMGGHLALHYACEPRDPRVGGVAAVCTPLDLAAAQKYIDAPGAWPYRRHVLDGLISIYEAVGERRPVPSDPALVRRVRTIYEWDRLTIVPRYGFDSVEQYYEALTIRRRMHEISVPTLLVSSRRDPIVPERCVAPFLGDHPPALEVVWPPGGGHIAFRGSLDLGYGPSQGLDAQVVHWLRQRGEEGP